MRAKELFEARKNFIFTNLAKNFDGVSTLDSKLFYGRINHKQFPVLPKEEYIKRFETNLAASGVSFVVDAFEALRRYVQSYVATSPELLRNSRSPIMRLIPETGYVDFTTEYQKYIDVLYNTIIEYFNQKNHTYKIKNFHDFVEHVVDFFLKTGGEFPITKTGFIFSRFCHSHVGGLYVDVSTEKISEDGHKEKILKSEVFNFYMNAAKKFGFLIDSNMPTRLVFNINSPAAQRYYNLYNLTSKAYYMDQKGEFTEFDINSHVHKVRYTIFGDNKGKGYTTHVVHGDMVHQNGPAVHVHKIEDFTSVGRKMSKEPGRKNAYHIHKINPIKKEQFFDFFYDRVVHTDVDANSSAPALRQLMLQLYENFIQDFPKISEVDYVKTGMCMTTYKIGNDEGDWRHHSNSSRPNTLLKQVLKNRPTLTKKQFDAKYGVEYFLPLYVKLRLLETSISEPFVRFEEISRNLKKRDYSLSYSDLVEKTELLIMKKINEAGIKEHYKRISF